MSKSKNKPPQPLPVSSVVPRLCWACDHYEGLADEDSGRCGRYPPTLFLMKNGLPKSYWPGVDAEDSCGEWKAKNG